MLTAGHGGAVWDPRLGLPGPRCEVLSAAQFSAPQPPVFTVSTRAWVQGHTAKPRLQIKPCVSLKYITPQPPTLPVPQSRKLLNSYEATPTLLFRA